MDKKADIKLSMNIEEKSDKITKEIIEMDELYCYTENKKRTYLITFVTKKHVRL